MHNHLLNRYKQWIMQGLACNMLQRAFHRQQLVASANNRRSFNLIKPMTNNAMQRRIYARQRAIAKGK
jgi:hypothetical protein